MDISSNKNNQKFMDFKTPNSLRRSPSRSKTLRRESVPEPDYSFNREGDNFKSAYFNEYDKQNIISRYRYNLFNNSASDFAPQPPTEVSPNYGLNNTFQDQSLTPTFINDQPEELSQDGYNLEDTPNITPDDNIQNDYQNTINPSNIFEDAIDKAPIDFPAYKPPRKKFFFLRHPLISSTVTLLVLMIGAGIIFTPARYNLNDIPYIIASYRAGFWPLTSSYKPSGYTLSSISSASGIVESSYQNNINGLSYSIVQKKSNISSSQLLYKYVINQVGLNYLVLNTKTAKVYVYNNSDNATWIYKGIIYLISDNGSLNNNQISNIASSI
jgi:hypothetical protein